MVTTMGSSYRVEIESGPWWGLWVTVYDVNGTKLREGAARNEKRARKKASKWVRAARPPVVIDSYEIPAEGK